MKRTSLFAFFGFLLMLVFASCQEDKWEEWKILNNHWIETHKTDSGFVQTESGLCYKIIHQGYMRQPNDKSVIVVKYKGTLIDGTVFDESDSYTASLSTMITGWIEGIKKMNVGGRYIFYVPASLGYGSSTTSDAIPPYSTLIFDVTLIDSYY